MRVAEPLYDPEIGASTGNVLLLNERQNLLTRMVGTYTWIGLNIYKQAQSVIRRVVSFRIFVPLRAGRRLPGLLL